MRNETRKIKMDDIFEKEAIVERKLYEGTYGVKDVEGKMHKRHSSN